MNLSNFLLINNWLSFIVKANYQRFPQAITRPLNSKLVFYSSWLGVCVLINLGILALLEVTIPNYTSLAPGATLDINKLPWLSIILIAPLLEEMIFRLGFRHPIHWAIASLFTLNYLIITKTSLLITLLFLMLWLYSLAKLGIHIFKNVRFPIAQGRKLKRHLPLLVHASTISFALMHLKNFNLPLSQWCLAPVLIAPQLLVGYVLCWIRIRHSFTAALIFHSAYNALIVVIIILA